jgi:hypothetical protein
MLPSFFNFSTTAVLIALTMSSISCCVTTGVGEFDCALTGSNGTPRKHKIRRKNPARTLNGVRMINTLQFPAPYVKPARVSLPVLRRTAPN